MANAKVGGTWRTVKLPYARVAGQWKPCKQMYAKVNGVWKITFDITEADPFDGSGSLSGQLTPGYAPWDVISGTWTESGGSVAASDNSDRVAALETGLENVEVEIDRTTAATGGTGVAFWIQDQSNWWGVRAYTEEYFIPFSFSTYYPRTCVGTYSTRTIATNPGTIVLGNQIPGNQVPGNTVPGNCTATTGCTTGCCPGTYKAGTLNPGNPVPGNYVSCFYTWFNSVNASNTNRFTSLTERRTCSCSGNSNANCSFSGLSFVSSNCPSSGACSPSPFPNSSCTVNTKGTFNRVQCGAACGNCSPISSFCLPGNGTSTGNTTGPCPFSSTNFLSSGQCTCTYTINVTNVSNNNPPTNNAPSNFAPTNNPPTFNNAPTNNTPTNNTPTNNPPTFSPATCNCVDSGFSNFPYLTFVGQSDNPISLPACSNTQPCSSNNPSGTLYSRNCTNCPTNDPSCTVTTFGANAAYYKRGQLIRKSSGTLNVIANQDFGDVGNIYAYTSGNTIGFRQYSAAGRGGTASNIVTYDAGNVAKGTRHGIIVTAVPYTQSYSIDRFKVNV